MLPLKFPARGSVNDKLGVLTFGFVVSPLKFSARGSVNDKLGVLTSGFVGAGGQRTVQWLLGQTPKALSKCVGRHLDRDEDAFLQIVTQEGSFSLHDQLQREGWL